ncbi:MAG: helix-turn-helix domain-containing protein [Pseudobdellovibrio sp.]
MDKKTVLHRIKMRRISLGLSQEVIAKEIQLTNGQYSRLERGDSEITLSNLIKLLEYLKLKFTDLDDDIQINLNLPHNEEFDSDTLKKELEFIKKQISSLEAKLK